MNDSYISQLVINVSQSLIGANVECVTDGGTHVGTKQILVTTGTPNPCAAILITNTLRF